MTTCTHCWHHRMHMGGYVVHYWQCCLCDEGSRLDPNST